MEDFVINLRCTHCGQKVNVPVSYAGKKVKCTKCGSIIVIPEAGDVESVTDHTGLSDSKGGAKYAGLDHALFDIPQENGSTMQLTGQGSLSEENLEELQKSVRKSTTDKTESFGKRKLPFFIDIFLYPVSFWGLVNLTIIIAVPLLLDFLRTIMISQLSCLFFLIALIIKVIVFLFMYWYFAE
jgi:ribosomal protein S27E